MLASHRAFAAAATLTVALAVGGTIADRRAVSADPVDALSAD